MVDQGTAGKTDISEARFSPEQTYFLSKDCTEEELIAAAKLYAREIVEIFGLNAAVSNVEWEISKRSKRRAGAVFVRNGRPVSVRLTWEFFQKEGWDGLTDTIRHELIHMHLLNEEEDATHGAQFRRWADKLDTPVKCDTFAEAKWTVECRKCGMTFPRYRKSKLVRNVDAYKCGECGGSLRVE